MINNSFKELPAETTFTILFTSYKQLLEKVLQIEIGNRINIAILKHSYSMLKNIFRYD